MAAKIRGRGYKRKSDGKEKFGEVSGKVGRVWLGDKTEIGWKRVGAALGIGKTSDGEWVGFRQ